MDSRFQRKVQTRKFAIDNSWRASPVQHHKEESVPEQTQDEDQRRWDGLIENLLAADSVKFNDGYFPLHSHRRILGPAIIFCKKAVRKLIKIFMGWYLFPIYARQSFFNGKMVNVVALERELLYSLNDQIAASRDETKALRQELDAARQAADRYREELAALSQRTGDQLAEGREKVRELRTEFDALCQEADDLRKDSSGLRQVTGGLKKDIDGLRRETEGLKKEDSALHQEAENLKKDSAVLYKETEGFKKDSTALRRETEGLRKDIAALLEDGERIRDRLRRIENLPTDDDQFYHDFEERFRGSRDLIRDRMYMYIPYIKEHLPDWSKGRFIDVGSGRGEWLDILRDNGATDYIGVDLNARQNVVAESFGHKTVCEDCVHYLARQPDESVDLISGFQLIEHLYISDMVELLRQSYRVLKKGGMILFETPNSEKLIVGANTFYKDLSHKRPLDPAMMKFIVEWIGFADVKTIEANSLPRWDGLSLENWDEKQLEDIKKINDVFWLIYGPADYAVFGVKE